MEMELVARKIIETAFEGKVDKSGFDYILHLNRVSSKFKDGSNRKIIAMLHDILEDCPEWNEKSLRSLFCKQIVDCVIVLTKGKSENYFDYINRVNDDFDARLVKREDLIDNMDLTRLTHKLKSEDLERIAKYHEAFRIINK